MKLLLERGFGTSTESGKGSSKVSLISTVKNEENSIMRFLDSLQHQSRQADEVVIVDGGSTDKTVDLIKLCIRNGMPLRLIIESGINIARGRNIAIKHSKYEIIAVTDAGCELDKDWLKNIIGPFERDNSIDVVSGWYEPDARNKFERYVAELTYPKLNRVLKRSDKFLPSSRSIAFKKICWEISGGYPEWLYTAEDTLFDLNMKERGFNFAFNANALVRWRVRSNFKSLFKQYYLYAKGDGQGGLFYGIYLAYGVLYLLGIVMIIMGFRFHEIWLLLFICIIIYMIIPISKICWKLKEVNGLFIIPLIILLIDIAKITGYVSGILHNGKP